jgi:hypothetical protein
MLTMPIISFFNPIYRRSLMDQERYLDERDYEAEHMDYNCVIDDDEDEEDYDEPENN